MHRSRIVAEAARADLRVARVDVHVQARRVQLPNAHGPLLPRHHAVRPVHQVRVARRRHAHRARKQVHAAAGVVLAEVAFLVRTDVQRDARLARQGDLLQLVDDLGVDLRRRVGREPLQFRPSHQAAAVGLLRVDVRRDPQPAHLVPQDLVVGVRVDPRAAELERDALADLLLQRHLPEDAVNVRLLVRSHATPPIQYARSDRPAARLAF